MTIISQRWCVPSETIHLGNDEVHVWRASLDIPKAIIPNLYEILTEDERERAERFRFVRDCHHFIAARAVLRTLLSRYVGVPPAQLRFAYTSKGKAFLPNAGNGYQLSFNLSHSHELALYAVARDRQVGVDVEYMRGNLDYEGISQHTFSRYEVATLRALSPQLRQAAFYACWTRKEAFVKALGEGLSYPLDQFDVSLALDQPAVLLRTYIDPHEANRWTLCELAPGPGYAGAVAVQGTDWQLLCWQWLHTDIG